MDHTLPKPTFSTERLISTNWVEGSRKYAKEISDLALMGGMNAWDAFIWGAVSAINPHSAWNQPARASAESSFFMEDYNHGYEAGKAWLLAI